METNTTRQRVVNFAALRTEDHEVAVSAIHVIARDGLEELDVRFRIVTIEFQK